MKIWRTHWWMRERGADMYTLGKLQWVLLECFWMTVNCVSLKPIIGDRQIFHFCPRKFSQSFLLGWYFFSLGWIRRFLFINIFFSNLLVNSYFASENGAWCRDVLHLGFGLSTGDPLLQEKVAWWRARMGIRALVLCWSRGRKLWAHTPVLKKPEFPDIS